MRKKQNRISYPPPETQTDSKTKIKGKVQPLIKTFRKKQDVHEEPSTYTPSHRNRNAPPNQASSKKEINIVITPSPQTARQKKSASKNQESKSVSKVNLKQPIFRQSFNPTTFKLQHILKLFQTPQQHPKSLLKHLCSANDQYVQLLYQWQKQEMYDEIDKLVYQIIQNQISLLQTTLENAIKPLSQQLTKYQECIIHLQTENDKIREENKELKKNQYFSQEIRERLIEYHHKNQWSTSLFHAIQIDGFDLQNYVKTMPLDRNSLLKPTFSELESSNSNIDRNEQTSKKLSIHSEHTIKQSILQCSFTETLLKENTN